MNNYQWIVSSEAKLQIVYPSLPSRDTVRSRLPFRNAGNRLLLHLQTRSRPSEGEQSCVLHTHGGSDNGFCSTKGIKRLQRRIEEASEWRGCHPISPIEHRGTSFRVLLLLCSGVELPAFLSGFAGNHLAVVSFLLRREIQTTAMANNHIRT